MKKLFVGAVVLAVVAIAWFLASPLFFDSVVNEDLPNSSSGLSEADAMQMEKLESMSSQEVDAMSEADRMNAKKMMDDLGRKMPDTVADEPMDSQPTLTVSGSFQDADSFHRGSGTASVYVLPDGKNVLRFENFAVTNGPALSVYLVRSADGSVDSGYLDLGKLKGNKGNQNYTLPDDFDAASYKSVVIWCVPFKVTFATALLR